MSLDTGDGTTAHGDEPALLKVDGAGDHLYLKSGDTWEEAFEGSYGALVIDPPWGDADTLFVIALRVEDGRQVFSQAARDDLEHPAVGDLELLGQLRASGATDDVDRVRVRCGRCHLQDRMGDRREAGFAHSRPQVLRRIPLCVVDDPAAVVAHVQRRPDETRSGLDGVGRPSQHFQHVIDVPRLRVEDVDQGDSTIVGFDREHDVLRSGRG